MGRGQFDAGVNGLNAHVHVCVVTLSNSESNNYNNYNNNNNDNG